MIFTENGIFNKAKLAKQKTKDAQEKEEIELSNINDTIQGYNTDSLTAHVKVGDYVSYSPDIVDTTNILDEISLYSGNTDSTKNTAETFTQETNLKWRVLDKDNGKVRLISETPTTSKITFEGAKGYNNAVYLLDKTCKTLYSKSGYSEKVQNLKMEDIEKYLTYDYKQKYGGTKTYTDNKYYPNLYKKEILGYIDEEKGTELNLSNQSEPLNETSSQAKTSIKTTQTYWYKIMNESDFSSTIYYNLFINNKDFYPTYWISSRCVDSQFDKAGFIIRFLYSGNIAASYLYYSDGHEDSLELVFRPVVTLNSSVLVESGDGTFSSPYIIHL